MVDTIFLFWMKQKLTIFSFPQHTQEAEAAEKADPPYPITCRAIVAAVVGLGVEDADRKRTWLADAEEAASRGAVETARAILGAATAALPTKKSVWRKAAELERAHGAAGAVDALLKKAVTFCPQVRFWGGLFFHSHHPHTREAGRADAARGYFCFILLAPATPPTVFICFAPSRKTNPFATLYQPDTLRDQRRRCQTLGR